MKKVLKFLIVIFCLIFISGCKKYDKLSYTKYNEYFSSKNDYAILDKTANFDINVRKYIESGDGNIQVFYIEFDNKNNALDYVQNMYSDKKIYKTNNDYTYIKSTKKIYFKLYRVDNVIVYGTTTNKKYRKQVRSVLKDLGY